MHKRESKRIEQKNRLKKYDLKTLEEENEVYVEAFNELKKITGGNDVNEIIQKYLI